MNSKKFSILALSSLYCVCSAQAQEDYIRAINDSTQMAILQVTERQISDIYQQLDSIKFVNVGEKNVDDIIFDIEDVNFVRRLNFIQREVQLNYNAQVRNYIDLYSTNRYRGHLCKMLGLGQYYFPIFEKALAEVGVPTEIKYLSIVESALNPHAVSRVGATGPWQFMYGTAKGYDLAMDNYIDERKDPLAASYAAARYLKDAYADFGDWLLAIASYNCGKGNVKRAIAKSGKFNPSFWDISPYLPRETRNYVPAFIAMTYMFGYPEDHQIMAAEQSELNLFNEVVMVDKYISLPEIAKALNIPLEKLKLHNPAYKRLVVNGTVDAPKRLVIPKESEFNKEELYLALNTAVTSGTTVIEAHNDDLRVAKKSSSSPNNSTHHRVVKGETLGRIASSNGVSVQDLKAWNNIKGNHISIGQRLIVRSSGVNSKLASRTAQASTSKYVTHTVKKGDTLSGIASNYKGATIRQIKADNNIKGSMLKPGTKLKINRS